MDTKNTDFSLTPEQLSEVVDGIIDEVINLISPAIKFTDNTHDKEIYEKLAPLFNETRLNEFKEFFKKESKGFIPKRIKTGQKVESIFNSKTILLAYYLSTSRARSLPNAWPLELKPLQRVYSDMGISPSWAVV